MQSFVTLLMLSASAFAAPTAITSDSLEARNTFPGGWCGLHADWSSIGAGGSSATVTVKDSKGNTLGSIYESNYVAFATPPFQQGGLPHPLSIKVNDGTDKDLLTFLYNGQAWGTSSSQCKVGKADGSEDETQLDCGFSC